MSKPLFISIRDIVLTQKGVKPLILKKEAFDNSVPYLDISALESDNIREFTFKELGNISTENDILVVWDGSRSGLPLRGKYGAIGSTLMKLTPIHLYSEYLYYFLKSKYDFINSNLTGGGIPHVNSDIFFDLQIPFIPFQNQKDVIKDLHIKIQENAFILKQQKKAIQNTLSQTDINYQAEENIARDVDNFKNAVLERAISGALTKDWRLKNNVTFYDDFVALGSVITRIKSGKSFRCLERPPKAGEVGVLKISALSSSHYSENESKTCIDKSKINPDLYIKKGDFLFSRANTKELVGACVIVEKVEKNIMLSDKILRVEFEHSKVVEEFILLFLRSLEGRRQIENYASGSQESMKNITQTELQSITLKIPGLLEQKEIVHQTTTLMTIADKVYNQYLEAVKISENLEKAILQQVFTEDHLKEYSANVSFEDVLKNIEIERSKLENERNEFNKNRAKAKSAMKKSITEVSSLDIEDVLKQTREPLTAKEVWKASKYSKDIDAFYEAIKHKVPNVINWEVIKNDEAIPESIISLKNDK